MIEGLCVGGLGYLEDYPARGRITVQEDWSYDRASGEMRLCYSNSLFAPGCLRIHLGSEANGLIVFLPGFQDGATDVLGTGHHPQNMTRTARELGMGVACWDWPLQAGRRDGRLYLGACFAYLAPLLGTAITTTIAAGSCARIRDLLAEGKTRLHGYFFYR